LLVTSAATCLLHNSVSLTDTSLFHYSRYPNAAGVQHRTGSLNDCSTMKRFLFTIKAIVSTNDSQMGFTIPLLRLLRIGLLRPQPRLLYFELCHSLVNIMSLRIANLFIFLHGHATFNTLVLPERQTVISIPAIFRDLSQNHSRARFLRFVLRIIRIILKIPI
jgi:hypothetical protein